MIAIGITELNYYIRKDIHRDFFLNVFTDYKKTPERVDSMFMNLQNSSELC